jgi:cyclopropane fatty-acyl-phospholipid synthase-like methyltransferase
MIQKVLAALSRDGRMTLHSLLGKHQREMSLSIDERK